MVFLSLSPEMIRHLQVLYTLTLPRTLSSSTLPTMAFFQHAMYILCKNIQNMKRTSDQTTLTGTLHEARKFYERLSLHPSHKQGLVEYPNLLSSQKGMKLSFRQVIVVVCFHLLIRVDPFIRDMLLHYPEENTLPSEKHPRESISLDIQPGQLVVIVGVNGSGKTSLLKLLPRLAEPKSGSIFVDDQPLHAYDIHQLRRSMAYLTQSEEIYPISLRENLLMGLADLSQYDLGNTVMVDEASRLGNSYDIIQRLGYDAILNPPPLVSQSFYGYGSGLIGNAAMEEYQHHSVNREGIQVSEGEKQRLVA
jgi:ABC-type multidrug transport system fused ATPase/permease subunit